MSNYTKATNFTAKDSLTSGDPAKRVKGTEIDVELSAVAAAIASKADSNSPTFTGTPAAPTAAAGTNTTQIATTAFVQAAVSGQNDNTETLTNKTISVDNNTISGIAATSFVVSNSSGNIDGSAAQKAIPAGVVVGTTDTQTLTNKTINLANNTITGTLAEFNTAISDADLISSTDFDSSLSATGYQELPGGLIIKWGTFSSTTDSPESFTFATAFPSACVYVNVTLSGAGNPLSFTKTGFTFNREDSIDGTVTGYYVAFGY